MDNYYKVNQDILQTNYKLNMIRNPEATFTDTIRIGNEINAQGNIPVTYTYRENGNINHRSYGLDREELKNFIRNHRDALVTLDGVNPVDLTNNDLGVNLEEINQPNIMEGPYSAPNLYADFQPIDSFQTSFDQKYNNSPTGNNRNIMDLTKISGNDVNFPNSNKLCDGVTG